MDTLKIVLAAAPIIVILLMLMLRVSPLWGALAGLAVAGISSAVAFPLSPAGVHTVAGMMPTMVAVALILLGGVGLAEMMHRSGAQDHISGWLQAAEPGTDRTITLFLLVYGLTPFMESVTGFGLGVVITAPLLIRIGLTPAQSVIVGLLGLVLVPWGSLGPGTLIAAELAGQNLQQLGIWSALLTLPVLIVSITVVVGLVIGRPTGRQVGLACLVCVVEWVALVGTNALVGVPLAGVLTSTTVIALLLVVLRLTRGQLPRLSGELRSALTPYFVLVAGILAMTSITSLTGATEVLGWAASPALWLLIAAGVAVMFLRVSWRKRRIVLSQCVKKWLPIAANALSFLMVGTIMSATGMADYLAKVAAQVGPIFTAAVPLIGALGGYVTGSNTGAAAMFSTATASVAGSIGTDPIMTVAGQNVGGSFAIIASPPRVALAVGVALPPGKKFPTSSYRVLILSVIATAILLSGVLAVTGLVIT